MRQLVYAVFLAAGLCRSLFAQDAILPTKGRDIIDPQILKGIQAYMLDKRFDAWIFSGSGRFDDLTQEFLGLQGATRHRWLILFPAMGTLRKPFLIYHPDDTQVFAGLSFYPLPYRSRKELDEHFKVYFRSVARRVALNHSPQFNIPELDLADAGLKEWLEQLDYEVISAGSLLSFYNTRWLNVHVETHAAAAAAVDSVFRSSVAWMADRIGRGKKTTDYDLAREMEKALQKKGMEIISPIAVRLDSLTRSEDYIPDKKNKLDIGQGSLVYLEVSARKRKTESAMYAQLGWTLCVDTTVDRRYSADWERVAAAAEAALEFLRKKIPARMMTLGFQVDEAAREKIGLEPSLLPRPLGRNLNAWGHGWGVGFDNYLAHDDREVLPGMGFTLEPGVYRERYALRMCNNVVLDGARKVVLSAPLQRKIIPVLGGPAALEDAFREEDSDSLSGK